MQCEKPGKVAIVRDKSLFKVNVGDNEIISTVPSYDAHKYTFNLRVSNTFNSQSDYVNSGTAWKGFHNSHGNILKR